MPSVFCTHEMKCFFILAQRDGSIPFPTMFIRPSGLAQPHSLAEACSYNVHWLLNSQCFVIPVEARLSSLKTGGNQSIKSQGLVKHCGSPVPLAEGLPGLARPHRWLKLNTQILF